MAGGTSIPFHLPEDVAIEILARLPVRSLLRFKCVCISWLALIRNPSFISKHLIHAPSIDDNARVVLKHWSRSLGRADVSFLSITNGAVSHDDAPMSMPFFNDDDDDDIRMTQVIFYGPCNGIICVFGDSYRTSDLISLWNPATREIKRLPISNVPHPDGHELVNVEIGFGFDAMSKDYKVIKIIDFQHRETRRYNRDSTLVEVYNLSTNCWRKIDQVVPTFMRIKDSWSTYLDGSYYWCSGDDNARLILSFSFADEVFEKILLPDLKNKNFEGTVTLLKYKESIALAASLLKLSESQWFQDSVVIWVLNKDGDKTTWDKLFRIKLECVEIIGFLSNGEALMVEHVYEDEDNYKSQLVLYDPSSRQVKHLQVYDAVYEPLSLQLVNYAESLVSFTPQGNLRV